MLMQKGKTYFTFVWHAGNRLSNKNITIQFVPGPHLWWHWTCSFLDQWLLPINFTQLMLSKWFQVLFY